MDDVVSSVCGFQKALISEPSSPRLVESSDVGESVHIYNLTSRAHAVTDSFQLIKGASVAHVLFEEFLIWLLALSPFMFKSICFPQFPSNESASACSCLAGIIFDWASSMWDKSKVIFTASHLPRPNFVLVSGSY